MAQTTTTIAPAPTPAFFDWGPKEARWSAASAAFKRFIYGDNGVPVDESGCVCGVVPREYVRLWAVTEPVPGSVPQEALLISEAAKVSGVDVEFTVYSSSPCDVSLGFYRDGRRFGGVIVNSLGGDRSVILDGRWGWRMKEAAEIAAWRCYFEALVKELDSDD